MEQDTISGGTSVRKSAGGKAVSHQRLWWMELTRGIFTFAFGLLFLAARSFAPRLFMYSLGAYLVVDGALELADLRRRKEDSRLKILDAAGGAMSLFAGLLSLLFPTIAQFFLAGVIAIRLIIRSLSQVRAALRSHSPLSWVSSGFFALLGLFLLLFPLLAITLLVAFLGSYMLVAGLYLMLRGLALRFGSSGLPASPSRPPQAPPGLSDNLPLSTRRAIVFVRRTAADGLGHIAWGFEWMNGWFNVGSVENLKSRLFANPEDMNFWSTHTLNPLATIQEREYPYDEYKLFFVTRPHPKDAWRTVIWESQQPYSFVHHNCNDVTYEILRTYGCKELLDPAKEYVPNDWYDALPGASYAITSQTAIPISLHQQSRREIATREIALAISPRMKGSPPPRRAAHWRAWEELTLVWEMMIGHVLTLWTSGIKLIIQHRRSSVPRL
ncbi:MAG TPA: DUF308 domain-containing protein [Ktedonobacteraceae bacterium]|nr:DUF308 domain-containing protein [Ktedonobacteraceae bacterium]